MKIGAAGAGYTSGSIYQRHQSTGYTPGSHYKRFGNFGLMQPGASMRESNRATVQAYNDQFVASGSQMFEAKLAQSEGLSEIAVQQTLARVQELAKQTLAKAPDLSGLAETVEGTGESVDETV